MTSAPAKRPCGSCPYRKDVPAGIWHPDEYAKLPPYDEPTYDQPTQAFACHQQDGRLCAGWVGTHDMAESMSLRLELSAGKITEEDFDACLDYTTDVELFESGAEAAAHGMAGVPDPDPRAIKAVSKLLDKGVGHLVDPEISKDAP